MTTCVQLSSETYPLITIRVPGRCSVLDRTMSVLLMPVLPREPIFVQIPCKFAASNATRCVIQSLPEEDRSRKLRSRWFCKTVSLLGTAGRSYRFQTYNDGRSKGSDHGLESGSPARHRGVSNCSERCVGIYRTLMNFAMHSVADPIGRPHMPGMASISPFWHGCCQNSSTCSPGQTMRRPGTCC